MGHKNAINQLTEEMYPGWIQFEQNMDKTWKESILHFYIYIFFFFREMFTFNFSLNSFCIWIFTVKGCMYAIISLNFLQLCVCVSRNIEIKCYPSSPLQPVEHKRKVNVFTSSNCTLKAFTELQVEEGHFILLNNVCGDSPHLLWWNSICWAWTLRRQQETAHYSFREKCKLSPEQLRVSS